MSLSLLGLGKVLGIGPLKVGVLVIPNCNFILAMFLKAWSIQNFGYDLRKPKSKSWLTIASFPRSSAQLNVWSVTSVIDVKLKTSQPNKPY